MKNIVHTIVRLRPDRLDIPLQKVTVGLFGSAHLMVVGIPEDVTETRISLTSPSDSAFEVDVGEGGKAYVEPGMLDLAGEGTYHVWATDAHGNPTPLGSGTLTVLPYPMSVPGSVRTAAIPVSSVMDENGTSRRLLAVKDQLGNWTLTVGDVVESSYKLVDPTKLPEDAADGDSMAVLKAKINAIKSAVKASCIAVAAALPLLCNAATLNEIPGTNEVYTAGETDARINDVVTNAVKDAVLLQETDPTVPAWAKSPNPPDFSVSNDTLVATIEAKAPAPDLSPSNATLVATIEATSPAPGDYAAVSNAAVHAATTNALQDEAIESNKVSIATNAVAISTLSDEVAPAVNGYARLYSFVTASTNANFVVTNYQLMAEAEAARTHFDPSDPDLDFSTVPPSLRLEDASSGTNRVVVDTRDWVVWYYAQKIGGAMAEAVSAAVDTCRAWCGFTATGLENPVPDTLVVDVPNIWLMAGKTFEKHVAGSNAVWIIRSSGVVMPISDNSQSAGGFMELTDAFGTPYIRFNKTESYFVDPDADGIEYDSATGAWLFTYTTASCPKGGANAVLEGSATYPGKAILKGEDDPDCPATITWTGSANNWVMHAVPKQIDGAVPPKMFFAAVVEVQGQDYIEYLRPMSIPHLLVDGVKIAPEIPASHPVGTTVPWKVVQ